MIIRTPRAKFLSSPENQVFRSLLDSLTGKGIRKHGQFIVAGEKSVIETLERWPHLVRNVLVAAPDETQAQTAVFELPSKLKAAIDHAMQAVGDDSSTKPSTHPSHDPSQDQRHTPLHKPPMKQHDQLQVLAFPPPLFHELDVHGTKKALLVVRTPELPRVDFTQVTPGLEVYCALGDPSNVGALIRSAAAFGAARIVLLQESASPFHPKATRAASASTLSLPLALGPSIHELAKLAPPPDAPWIALDMDGLDIHGFTWPRNARLLIGQEGQGVPTSPHFRYLKIPMTREVESLNATVASSIALFAWSAKRTSSL